MRRLDMGLGMRLRTCNRLACWPHPKWHRSWRCRAERYKRDEREKERERNREIERESWRELHRCIWIWKCVCGFAGRQVMQTCALLTCMTCPAAALLGNCQIELANRHSLHSAPSAAVAKRRPDENCIRCKLNSLIIAFHIDAKCRLNLTGQTAVSLLLHPWASSPLPAPAMLPFGCTLMHRLNAIKWLSHLLTFLLRLATSFLLILLQPPARLPLPLYLFIFHLFCRAT